MRLSDSALVAALGFLVATPGCGLFDRCSGASTYESKHVTKYVTPIPEAQLATLLPEVSGLSREPPKTEKHTEGKHSLTRASAEYTRQVNGNTSKLKLEITDGTHFQAVNARLAILAHAAGDVHMKSITVKQQAGIQRFLPESERSEVLMVVGARFLVTLESDKEVDKQDINAVLEAIDFAKLETLAKAP